MTATDVWGSTNDVSHSNSHIGLKHLINFVQSNSHKNIINMHVPHRYYLDYCSSINTKVKTFNRKPEKLMKTFKHVVTKQILPENISQDMVFTRTLWEKN